jgi:uncharacterized protein (TIGR03067 family)
MLPFQFRLLVIVLALAPPMAKNDASDEDLKRFQGKWMLVSITIDGKASALADDQYWTIKGNKILYDTDDRDDFKLDASKKPKFISVHCVRKDLDDYKLHGVYELDGDLLRICAAGVDKDCPKGFKSEKGSGRWLVVLKKLKD